MPEIPPPSSPARYELREWLLLLAESPDAPEHPDWDAALAATGASEEELKQARKGAEKFAAFNNPVTPSLIRLHREEAAMTAAGLALSLASEELSAILHEGSFGTPHVVAWSELAVEVVQATSTPPWGPATPRPTARPHSGTSWPPTCGSDRSPDPAPRGPRPEPRGWPPPSARPVGR